jgi:hypothetical protein
VQAAYKSGAKWHGGTVARLLPFGKDLCYLNQAEGSDMMGCEFTDIKAADRTRPGSLFSAISATSLFKQV